MNQETTMDMLYEEVRHYFECAGDRRIDFDGMARVFAGVFRTAARIEGHREEIDKILGALIVDHERRQAYRLFMKPGAP